ncbi:hypothetical protein TWF225_009220 [Orbilia oligospora]|nr:hypothetical protein TWF751_010127 [Orbilia oligospora]KAF3193663.1 hypothetical protein TWF225_009220 [Orbilia oligospora]KAF3269850.1 hypothetical protein TWF217_008204 [Orbilia oligospora]KAF3270306.1 hypothetical protein TWF128_004095 [Orbilia oligospora]KAF3278980.1 hypothetical protein TWF132_000775 [Orbilia oligospora]
MASGLPPMSPSSFLIPSNENTSSSAERKLPSGLGIFTNFQSPQPPEPFFSATSPIGDAAWPWPLRRESNANTLNNLIPCVKYMDFERFKNRYTSEDGHNIIEVLRGGNDLIKEVYREEKRRKGRKKDSFARRNIKPLSDDVNSNGWIHRIRIQSPPVLKILGRIANGDFGRSTTPLTFFRPFKLFIYYQPEVKKVLSILEERWANKTEKPGTSEANAESTAQGNTKDADADDIDPGEESDEESVDGGGSTLGIEGSDIDTIEALEHLRCYVEFVDKELMHLPESFSGTTRRRIRFSDLWYLFKLGDYVYWRPAGDSTASKKSDKFDATRRPPSTSAYQSIWMVYGVSCSNIDDDDPDDIEGKNNSFTVWAYSIDYDGQRYGMITKRFDMGQWAGEKEITSLDVYPIRYCKQPDVILADLKDRGKRFQACIERRHLYYEGWTMADDSNGLKENHIDSLPQHVESDVIVDFLETLQSNPSWKPEHATLKLHPDDYPIGEDSMVIFEWLDAKGGRQEIQERTLRNDSVVDRQQEEYIKSNPFLLTVLNGLDPEITENEYILLPRRLLVYILRERKFAKIDVTYVKDISVDSNPFDDLKLKSGYKELVQSLVDSHFKKNKIQKESQKLRTNQDLILGKGAGLIILLHGVPGVGKTATAEAVAQSNRKPLFVITCGDLGFTPKEVENSLTEIFRLAGLWDCVLLLDEADIFLSRREKSDLKRNALVSVFLRVLEYYSGILFLTTNRVGHLDEAFKSRIHISLYYEPLDKDQTIEIFKMNMARLEKMEKERVQFQETSNEKLPEVCIEEKRILDFADRHFDDSDEFERWNGRQIRNAFQIAFSLANYEFQKSQVADVNKQRVLETADTTTLKVRGSVAKRSSSRARYHDFPVLDDIHFKQVAEATRKFSQYMQAATNSTDRDFAQSGGYRADDWHYDDRQSPWARQPVYPGPRISQYGAPPPPLPRGSGGGGRYGSRPPPPPRGYSREADGYDWGISYEDAAPPSRNAYIEGPYDDRRRRRDGAQPDDDYSQASASPPSRKQGDRRGSNNVRRKPSDTRESGRSRRKDSLYRDSEDNNPSEDELSH